MRDYSSLHGAKDRLKIAGLIRLRFTERYLDPALDNPKRHGFSILAIGCLMVTTPFGAAFFIRPRPPIVGGFIVREGSLPKAVACAQ